MEEFLIYLSPDIDTTINKQLVELGYSTISGSNSDIDLQNKHIRLFILTTKINNLDFAKKVKSNLHKEILFIIDDTINQINTDDLVSLEPLGVLSMPIIHYEFKINILSIVKKLSKFNLISQGEIWSQALMNATTDAVVEVDSMGKIKHMNSVAQQLVGIENHKAVGVEAQRVLQFKISNNEELNYTDEVFDEYIEFEGEIYNRIAKQFIHISGKMATVKDNNGNSKGKTIIIKDIRELKNLFSKINYHTSHDNLTGLLNRKSFIEETDKIITLSKFDGRNHGLIVISIDKFKVVNDTCGHTAGDELLRKIAYIINENDKFKIAGRISGDEFGILVDDASITEIKHLTKSIKTKISQQDFIWGEKEFPIRCCYGIVTINKNTVDHYTLFAAVDDAISIAKEKGGGKIEIYNNLQDEYNKRRGDMSWMHKLKNAISGDLFELYYQEIIPISPEDTKKIEILVRLKDENGKIITPDIFIPPAEHYGIMPEIDKIIIEKSVLFCKELIENPKNDSKYILSVNLSATSMLDKSLASYIISVFQKFKVPPTLFCFEITETSAIKNMNIAKYLINNLKAVGCQFSIDDFGSGFSNFSYLRHMNVDYLKIDGSFISEIIDDPISLAMVESINNIGHILKLKTVAEFVSNKEIQEELIKIGVDYLQGYSISIPTPLKNLLS